MGVLSMHNSAGAPPPAFFVPAPAWKVCSVNCAFVTEGGNFVTLWGGSVDDVCYFWGMKNIVLAIAAACALGCAAPASAFNLNDSLMTNPMIWADVPDPDVIRVGDDFYMVTTTMHLMPGCPVMHSRDLVNWRTVSYVYDTLDDIPAYGLDGDDTVYGRGQWATTLRYHDGWFYVLFGTNDEPHRSYIYRARAAEGPWELVSRPEHFHDSSMLFDDDGRVYVFSGSGDIRLCEMEPDLSGVKPGGVDQIIISPSGDEKIGLHEGSRAFKHNGKYYLYVIAWPAGKPRRQLCYRADSLTGPWEKQVVLQTEFGGFSYLAQGTVVDDPQGRWWGVIFQDRGGVGRVLTLIPCTWTDGWPVLGDAEGHVPEVMLKPVAGEEACSLVRSDSFDDPVPGMHWQWNHNPDAAGWSLTERPGHLRLRTTHKAPSIYHARNTISQRMEGPGCTATVRLDASGMLPGDAAGLGAFNGHSGLLSVKKQADGSLRLCLDSELVSFRDDTPTKTIANVDSECLYEAPLTGTEVWLRIGADFRPGRDVATFAYSEDGEHWTEIPAEYRMQFDYRRLFMGTRLALYNYATEQPGGHVDFDFFDYSRRD